MQRYIRPYYRMPMRDSENVKRRPSSWSQWFSLQPYGELLRSLLNILQHFFRRRGLIPYLWMHALGARGRRFAGMRTLSWCKAIG